MYVYCNRTNVITASMLTSSWAFCCFKQCFVTNVQTTPAVTHRAKTMCFGQNYIAWILTRYTVVSHDLYFYRENLEAVQGNGNLCSLQKCPVSHWSQRSRKGHDGSLMDYSSDFCQMSSSFSSPLRSYLHSIHVQQSHEIKFILSLLRCQQSVRANNYTCIFAIYLCHILLECIFLLTWRCHMNKTKYVGKVLFNNKVHYKWDNLLCFITNALGLNTLQKK